MNKQYFLLYVKNYEKNISKNDTKKFETGDLIRFYGEFNEPEKSRNEGGFNYKLYLKTKKISGSFLSSNVKKIGKDNSLITKINIIIYKIRENILKNYKSNLSNVNANLISALTIGDKSNLEKEVVQKFRDASLSHILAISGAHFSYIILIINCINKLMKRKRLGQIILLVTIIFFMKLTGNSASVVRAGIMSIMIILSSMFYKKNDFLTTFSISLLIQIIFNPYVIFDVGLLLSYFGTLGIVFFYKIINNKLKLKVLSITLSANLMIFPIMIYNFNVISISFVISNFFASIFLGPIIILGIISNILKIKPIFIILNFLLTMFRKSVEICSKLPFSKIYITTPNFISIIIYYLILILIYNFCSSKEKISNSNIENEKTKNKSKKLKVYNTNEVNEANKFNGNTNKKSQEIRNEKQEQSKIKNSIIILAVLMIIFNINYQNIFQKFNKDLLINFVDVGQGDSTLIRYNGKNILIDGGGSMDDEYDVGEKVLLPYLLDKKIKNIDYLIFSHFDTDHCQGLIYLMDKIKIKNAIIGIQAENYENYEKFLDISKRKNVNVIVVKSGDRINIEKNLFLDIIWPNEDKLIANNSINNNSLVCKLVYNNFSMLFTGDIEKEAEEAILKNTDKNQLKSTILKVAHHGSKTSSINLFLENVNPRIALIGVGKNNKFNHPSQETIKKLNNIKCKIFRTDEMGEITIKISKKGKICIRKIM